MKSALSCLSLLACLSVAPLALATSPGEAAAASKTESGAIVGVITLPVTDEPIEGARVVLRCDCLEAPLEGSTDARGIYRFEALAAGTYTIEVFHGAANINKVFELPRGAKFRANFSIDPEDGEPRTIVISTTPVASEDAIKSLPVGAETSRDWTAIVDISPSAARDAAGVGATGKVDYWREADPGPRSGTLTAGTIDDSHDASELRDFAILSFGPRDFARKLGMAARTEVVIVDALGRPVADAIVQARVNDQGHSIQLRTGTDGRAVVSGFDLGLDPTEPSPAITFFASKAGTSRTTTARLGEDPVELRLRLHRSSKTTTVQGLDLALILDTTGSMGDEIGWLQAELRSVIDTVLADHPGIDVRLALVNYRDAGDAYVVDPLAFTSERQVFRTELADTRATGGGDYPEAVAQALATAASFDWRHDQGVAKVALLVADAPPHDNELAASALASRQLREAGVSLYPVASSGTGDLAELVFRSFAADSGAQYLFLTDDSGVGLPHAEPHTEDYEVELLRDALIRVLRAELEGAETPKPERPARAAFGLQTSLFDGGGIEAIEGGPTIRFGM